MQYMMGLVWIESGFWKIVKVLFTKMAKVDERLSAFSVAQPQIVHKTACADGCEGNMNGPPADERCLTFDRVSSIRWRVVDASRLADCLLLQAAQPQTL